MSKFRNPISIFIYQNKYYLQLYKLTEHFSSSLASGVTEKFINSTASFNTYYSVIADDNIKYLYKGYSPKKPIKFFLNLYGKGTRKIFGNDTILDYYSEIRNFSIGYDQQKLLDICGNSKEDMFRAKYEPFEILFFKDKDNSLYLMMMSVYDKNIRYIPGTLYDLMSYK